MNGQTRNVELIRTYGDVISHATLSHTAERFSAPLIEGFVGYKIRSGLAVALGAPVAPPNERLKLFDAFERAANDAVKGVVWVGAPKALAKEALERGHGVIEFGERLLTDPRRDPEKGSKGKKLRQKCNKARRAGLEVREQKMTAELTQSLQRWKNARRGIQLYLDHKGPFDQSKGRRWFCAYQEEKLVGAASMLKVSEDAGSHLINHVFSTDEAPARTNELLVVTALSALREEGATSACLGLVPKKKLGKIRGVSSVSERIARSAYDLIAEQAHLGGKKNFWKKFKPTQRDPLYLLFSPSKVGWRVPLAIVQAFNASYRTAERTIELDRFSRTRPSKIEIDQGGKRAA